MFKKPTACLILLILLASSIFGQSQSGDSPLKSLFKRPRPVPVTLTIDTTNVPLEIPKSLEVLNGTTVTVKAKKSPITSCTVEIKREDLAPPPNPIAQFLGIIVKLPLAPASSDLVDLICKIPSTTVPEGDAEAKQIDIELGRIKEGINETLRAMNAFRQTYENQVTRISKFTACIKGVDVPICTSEETFNAEKKDIGESIRKELDKHLPTTGSIDIQIDTLSKVLANRYKDQTKDQTTANWIANVNKRLDCYLQALDSIKETRKLLLAVQVELRKFLDALAAHVTTVEFTKPIPVDRNAKVSGTLTCTNHFTKQVASSVPFTVIYRDIPTATVSAGILFSLLRKRQIGTTGEKTGVDASGNPTFKPIFAELDRAKTQIIPFSYFNYYLSGTNALNLNLSGGLGVNPNNGKTQLEYFFGLALGTKNLYVNIGSHFGRFQELGGGFKVGDTVPDKFPATLPIERRYTAKFGIGISYKIPLP